MSILKECSFYRDFETHEMGRGIGYCELGCDQTICDGNIDFCEIPYCLKQYLRAERRREEWEKKRNAHFSENQKV
jgi:hypothetical protein